MKFLFIMLAATLVSAPIVSFAGGMSSIRRANEAYENARTRHWMSLDLRPQGRVEYPEKIKKDLLYVDINEIPDVLSYGTLESQFKYVRDARLLSHQNGSFMRRLTWLFPDDGCYARAEMAKFALTENSFPLPKKIYAFGNLRAATKNTSSGWVQWWYHVAVAYRVGSVAYVLDPALEPSRPLKLQEWHALIGGTKTRVQYAICSAHTFDPSSDCLQAKSNSKDYAFNEQEVFLDPEWDRLNELGRNPEAELGDSPPWK